MSNRSDVTYKDMKVVFPESVNEVHFCLGDYCIAMTRNDVFGHCWQHSREGFLGWVRENYIREPGVIYEGAWASE